MVGPDVYLLHASYAERMALNGELPRARRSIAAGTPDSRAHSPRPKASRTGCGGVSDAITGLEGSEPANSSARGILGPGDQGYLKGGLVDGKSEQGGPTRASKAPSGRSILACTPAPGTSRALLSSVRPAPTLVTPEGPTTTAYQGTWRTPPARTGRCTCASRETDECDLGCTLTGSVKPAVNSTEVGTTGQSGSYWNA